MDLNPDSLDVRATKVDPNPNFLDLRATNVERFRTKVDVR
jgi:hypothetical protein